MATTLPKIFIREHAYIPLHMIPDRGEAKRKYTKMLYKDANCARCEHKAERHSEHCDTCPSFEGELQLFKVKTISGDHYLGVPTGDKNNIERKLGIDFNNFRIIDKRVAKPFDYNVKFKLTLRDYQEKIARDFKKHNFGVIESPPRSGKTPTTLGIAIRTGYKILILASQHEFLMGFMDHIYGNDKPGEETPMCTNIPFLEKKYGKKLAGFIKKPSDIEDYQIILATYQSFASKKGQKLLRLVSREIGTVLIDEVHKSGAKVFASVMQRLQAKIIFGCTGTVKRKDGRHTITRMIVGPVVARSTVEMLLPRVVVHETEAKPKTNYKTWPAAMSFLANHQKRNEQIVDWIVRDVKAGHSVVVPITIIKHAVTLCNMVNKKFGNKQVAEIFQGASGEKGKERRKQILSRAKNGTTKVIFGTRSLIQMGLNVPPWSVIYEIIPINNEPNLRQETARIRTPMEGKTQPIVRLFVDTSMAQSLGCAKHTITHLKGFGFDFSNNEKQKKFVNRILLAARGRMAADDDDDFKPMQTINYAGSGGLSRFIATNKAGR